MKKRQLAGGIFLLFLVIAAAAAFLYNRPVLRQAKMDYTKYSVEHDLDQTGSLVGFTDQHQYYMNSRGDEFVYYLLSDGILNEIYTSDASAIFFDDAYDDALIIGEFGVSKEMKFTVKKIGNNMEELLYEGSSNWLPDVRIVGDFLVINYGKYDSGRVVNPLILLDLNKNSQKTIAEYEYQMNEDGSCTGDLLEAVDGFDKGIIFEVIRFDHEPMQTDETGKTELFYYDFASETIQQLPIEPERKLLYAGGDRECVITSDYAYAMPLEDIGILYVLKGEKYVKLQIPEIDSANDIRQAYRISDHMIAVNTIYDLYFINVKNFTYERIQNVFGVRKFKETIAYTKRDGDMEFCAFQGGDNEK